MCRACLSDDRDERTDGPHSQEWRLIWGMQSQIHSYSKIYQ